MPTTTSEPPANGKASMWDSLFEVYGRKLFFKIFWRVMVPLASGYGICLLDRGNMGVAQIQMSYDLGLTQTEYGFASSIFFLSYMSLQLPANYLLARFGATRLLATYLCIWGVISSAHGLVTDKNQLNVLRFLMGCFEAGYYPGAIYVLTRWFPNEIFTFTIAIFGMTDAGAQTFMGGSGGLIMDYMDGFQGLRGWRWLFLIQGTPGIMQGLYMHLYFTEKPADAKWLTSSEREAVLKACDQPELAQERARTHSLTELLLQLVRLPTTWIFAAFWFTVATDTYVHMFFNPKIAKDILADWSITMIGLLGIIPGVIRAVLYPFVAAWADRGGAERTFAMVYDMTLVIIAFSVVGRTPLLLASLQGEDGVGAGQFYMVWNILVQSWIVSTASASFWALHSKYQPAELLPFSIAFVNMVAQSSGLTAPWAFGAMHDYVSPSCPLNGTTAEGASASSFADGLWTMEGKNYECPAVWGVPLMVIQALKLSLIIASREGARRRGLGLPGPAKLRDGAVSSYYDSERDDSRSAVRQRPQGGYTIATPLHMPVAAALARNKGTELV